MITTPKSIVLLFHVGNFVKFTMSNPRKTRSTIREDSLRLQFGLLNNARISLSRCDAESDVLTDNQTVDETMIVTTQMEVAPDEEAPVVLAEEAQIASAQMEAALDERAPAEEATIAQATKRTR